MSCTSLRAKQKYHKRVRLALGQRLQEVEDGAPDGKVAEKREASIQLQVQREGDQAVAAAAHLQDETSSSCQASTGDTMGKQKSPLACSPVQQDELHRCLWRMTDWVADNPAHNLGSFGGSRLQQQRHKT